MSYLFRRRRCNQLSEKKNSTDAPEVRPYLLCAVWLFDHAVNMERPENGHSAFIVGNDHSVAAWRLPSTPNTRAHPTSEPRTEQTARALVVYESHQSSGKTIPETSRVYHLRAVEADVEITTDKSI